MISDTLYKSSRLSNFSKAKPIDLVNNKNVASTLAWNANGTYLATGSLQTIRLFSCGKTSFTQSPQEITVHTNKVQAVCWHTTNPDRLSSGSKDKTVKLFDLKISFRNHTNDINMGGEVINLKWHPTRSEIVACGLVKEKEDYISFLDLRGGTTSNSEEHNNFTYKKLAADSDEMFNEFGWEYSGELFFLSTNKGKIKIFQNEVDQVYSIDAHNSSIYCIDFDPKGRFFATGGIEAIAGLWEFEDLSCIKTFGDVEDEIRGLSFSHDGDLLAIGTSKGTRDRESSLSIAIETGETVFKVKSPNGISSLAFHPSRLLLAVARDKHDCPEIKAELKGYEICKVCKGMNPRDYEKKEPTVKLYGMVS